MDDRLLVLNMESDSVSVVDPASGITQTTVETDPNPHEVVVTPDGDRAYVACSSSDVVDVIDLATYEVVDRIEHDTFDFPHGFGVAGPDAETVYLAGTRSNQVYVLDPATDEVVDHVAVPGELTHMIEVTADGSTGYVANIGSDSVTVVDLDDLAVVTEFDVGGGPEGIALGPDEETLYVANQEDDDLRVVDLTDDDYRSVVELPLDRTPVRVVRSPDDRHLLVANREAGTLSILDHEHTRVGETTPWEIERLRVGLWTGGICFDPDGDRAYVANNKTNDVSVVAMGPMEELRRVDTELHPDGIAYLER